MTFFHLLNCVALTYAPHFILYKYSGLAEYSSVWKLAQAGLAYIGTQLCKLLALATFFPTIEHEGETFAFLPEFMKTTVDLVDLVGIYLIISYSIAGKGEVRFLAAGLGWATTECLATRLLPLWFGARGVGFDWVYIQMALDSNLNLICLMGVAALIWLHGKNDLAAHLRRAVQILLVICGYRTLIFGCMEHLGGVDSWSLLLMKSVLTAAIATSSFLVYSNATPSHSQINNHHR